MKTEVYFSRPEPQVIDKQLRRLGLAAWIAVLGILLVSVEAAAAENAKTLRVGSSEHAVTVLDETAVYDSEIPNVEAFFGNAIGEMPLDPVRVSGYATVLARTSDRVTVEQIGSSYEGHHLYTAVFTAPENQARLDEIRDFQRRRISGLPVPEDAPVIVWMNFGVHGHEGAGLEAAPLLMHQLAAEISPEMDELLQRAVVIVVPLINPDGHARRVAFKRSFSRNVVNRDINDRGNAMSPRGGGNHYGLNLNRDWLLVSQPETRAMVRAWQSWKPNVTADFHEMSTIGTYYFHPGVEARKNPLIPEQLRVLAGRFAVSNGRMFDTLGQLYYSAEGFDNMYPGKGSTYPQLNGSVGILFEAGNARSGEVDTRNGLRTLAENSRLHGLAGLETIRTSVKLRVELFTAQADFYEQALRSAGQDETAAYIVSSDDLPRLARFFDLLDHHQIQALTLLEPVTIEEKVFKPGASFVVSLSQPQYTMIRTIFDRGTAFEEARFYDVSGWTLPDSFDLTYSALTSGQLRKLDLGGAFEPRMELKPSLDETTLGYAVAWDRLAAAGALYDMLEGGLIVRVAQHPTTLLVSGQAQLFPRGSLFVPVAGQAVGRQDVLEMLRRASSRRNVAVFSLESADALEEGRNPGGRTFVPISGAPKILLVAKDALYRRITGEIFFFLDQQAQLPVTLARIGDLGDVHLADYSHIIIGNDDYADTDTEQQARLVEWVEAGGSLIAIGSGARWVQQTFLGIPPDNAFSSAAPAVQRADFEQRDALRAVDVIGGAIMASDLDPTHPIAFGHQDRNIASMRTGTFVLRSPDDRLAMVAEYQAKPLLSGYASEIQLSRIASTPSIIALVHGEGRIIMFADSPVFRGVFPGMSQILTNSLFFASLIRGE